MKKRRAGVVSVVLVNFRGADDTIHAVEELQRLDWPREQLEIVVVENGSGDDSGARLRELGDAIVLVESVENRGFAGGSNLGVAKSTGEFVAFLNNDARPDARWIAEAMATFERSPRIGAVASKVLDWEGERVDFVDGAVTWYGMGYKPHAGERDRGSWDEERDVLFGTGAAMFVRGAVYDELGGFDEDYFMFYEDVDLGWRLNLAGHRFRYQPRSLAYHKHHASMDKFGSFREQYLLERNALYTLYKNLDDDSLAQVLSSAVLLAVRRATARGELDTTSLDIRRAGDDSVPVESVSKQTLAGIYAIDQFVELLPEMTAKRAAVQAGRVRTDRDISGLLGVTDEPAYPIEPYLRGYEKIVDTLGQLGLQRRTRVLVITGDPVGERMAGPAIRAWNIAKLLSEEHDVRLVSMSSAEPLDDVVEVGVISLHRPKTVVEHEEWADVIVVQGHALELFPSLEKSNKILVVDIYDPMHLEQLEQGRGKSINQWNKQISEATESLNHQLALGDFFLCASEQQRHFWLGQLAGLGRVNAYTYAHDTDLDNLIAVAPFGIPEEPPVATRPAMRGVVPGIGADDKILIWAGGIYDWFDPESLIEAISALSSAHPELRLFFMGVKHPNPAVPEMEAVTRAKRRAADLGVLNTHVFFNESWVPYDERQNYLLEADLGVSTHFQHVETTFSFRTRILDYLWAGLPIVTTAGDSFGTLVEAEELGAAVPEQDAAALAAAIERYLYHKPSATTARKNVERLRETFRWRRTLAPLVEFLRDPKPAADKGAAAAQRSKQGKGLRARPAVYVAPKRATGVRRDFQRVAYYLNEGGPSAVVERYRARLKRKREAGQ
ncbi:glycosyltransferase [Leifsonia sp. TF02-11]|nr:glycosyltransferase [Leifsonia sp. TF02-11]